jgi:hypothetical protein
MSDAVSSAQSGRNAAIARRVALSAGKAALPPATERVSAGRRGAVLPASVAAAPASMPAPQPATESQALSTPTFSAGGALSGRHLAIERRRLLSAGKAALGAPAGSAVSTRHAAASAPAAAPAVTIEAAPSICADTSCRAQARARRAALSQHGRGDAAAALPARPTRVGKIDYAPKVTESPTQAGQRVTGLRIGQGPQVTGDERGTSLPVSGTQYIAAEGGGAWRAGGPKVGHARTDAGLVVSGTLVRSKVRITGDEAGGGITITGEADQRLDDDVTQRVDHGGYAAAQFQRQANPHGGAVFAGNLGRSARSFGSRERSREVVLEATDKGLPITGAALGRSLRVTGDEGGACRSVTGTQYLAPARRQTACGFAGGGTATAAQLGGDRADPVTAGKVTVAQSWGGQRITGFDVEHNPRVTGDAPGSCAPLTGSQYQGRVTVDGYCAPSAAGAAAARRAHGPGTAVTGDTPINVESVSGTARGAGRDITGTPYYRAEPTTEAPAGGAVAVLDDRFSVKSPQRAAQLRAAGRAAQADDAAPSRITGSFAVGTKNVTGNLEFLVRPRSGGSTDKPPAHARISGEGRAAGNRITGDSWADQRNVTGTDGAFAADRNPTVRGPKAKPFAGATAFKGEAKHEEPKQLVTGMFGYFSKTGARVTLSGGAQS